MFSTELSIDEYRSCVGQEIGLSRWFPMDQIRIDGFASVTEDGQFIHVNPQRASETVYGSTIAHGMLTLSMLPAMSYDVLPKVVGEQMLINYGLNTVRFIAPVLSGKRIRGRFTLQAMLERKPGQWQRTIKVAVEIENEQKPALLADWMLLSIL